MAMMNTMMLLALATVWCLAYSPQRVEAGICDGVNNDNSTSIPVDSDNGISVLLAYCLRDERCKQLYSQTPSSTRLFGHLLRTVMASSGSSYADVEDPLSALCASESTDDAQALLWGMILKYMISVSSVCPINERFVLTDPDLGTGECICMPDRSCSYQDTLPNVLIALMFIIIILLISVIVLYINSIL